MCAGNTEGEHFLQLELHGAFPLIFSIMSSVLSINVGNLPSLCVVGPKRRGICFMMVPEAKKKLYLFASFLTFFLSLLKAFKASTSRQSIPLAWACSMWKASPSTQQDRRSRGMFGSLMEPAKRLSFCVS